MTVAQHATIAFLAMVIRKSRYARSHNVKVYLVARPEYAYVFRGEFDYQNLSLKVEPNNDRVYKDELIFSGNGIAKIKVRYEDKLESKIQISVNPRQRTFEGRKDNRDFTAEFDGTDIVRITDPERKNSEFVYRVELY